MTARYQTHPNVTRFPRLLRAALLLLAAGWAAPAARAQGVVNVPQGLNTLSAAIAAAGPNTTLVLQRDGFYLNEGELTIPVDKPITIVAADGAGARPAISAAVATGGSAPEQVIRVNSDLTLRGVYVSGVNDLGGLATRIIRISQPYLRLILEDVHLDDATQSAFRFDADSMRVYMRNSIASNMGRPESRENGRVFDDRGNDIDTLVSVNNTFYNITSRVLRDGGGIINYAAFDHNTFFNTGQQAVTFGETRSATFTNNIVVNGAFYGRNTGAATPEQNEMVELDSLSVEGDQAVDIRNNAFYTDPALLAVYPSGVVKAPEFDATVLAYLADNGTESTNLLDLQIAFADAPPAPVGTVTSYYADPTGAQVQIDVSGQPYDFSYPTTSAAYTAGTDGGPIGSLVWFGITNVGVEEEAEAPARFELLGNYPNPFNPSTTLAYRLDAAASVRVELFNLLGQRVRVFEPGVQPAGVHELFLDASELVSGLYLARVHAGSEVRTLTMTLAK